ncbi:MAG: SBBP repeat-containing protein [Deltaproteobacteria bacterium]|nr:SBBP repeat-containing protein [Deltaproteobacteria bacterium]
MQPVGCINGARALALIVGLIAVASCATQKSHTLSNDGLLPLPRNSQIETSAAVEEPGVGTKTQVQAVLSKLPLYFIENRGQLDARVAYYLQGRDTAVYFTATGLTFALTGPEPGAPVPETPQPGALLHPVAFKPDAKSEAPRQRWALKLDFVGANPQVQPIGHDRAPAVISYFKGPQSQWQTGLQTYASVVYPELWPGVDLVYSGTSTRLKYTFVVKPGADPNQIKLAYRGATAVRRTEGGQLAVETAVGGFADERPYAYQEEGEGQRTEVAAAYAVEDQEGAYGYGFTVGAYDQSKPLVLDPAVLVYAGYIGGGGSSFEEGRGIAVDSAGDAYVTGTTGSTEATFPVTVGPDLTFNNGGSSDSDAFVAKVRADGTGLVYAGCIGGSGLDGGNGIAVDSRGDAYVTGGAISTETTFPVTVGPDLTFNGNEDAFVAKVGSLAIQPSRGGNTGSVSVIIHGIGFAQGATVKLVRAGQPDIIGDPVSVSEDDQTIATTFDLIG